MIDRAQAANDDRVLFISVSPGFKEKDSANLVQSVKICIRGQFFVLNKIRRGARLIF